MFLIVGLGNPGEEYEHTRHNAGFDAVDLIAEEVGARYWKTECGALTTKGVYRDHDLVLAKPQSYMNTSGGPVKQLMNAYGVDAEHLIVVHDELDIDPGTVRVKFGGRARGAQRPALYLRQAGNARLASRARGHRAPAGTHARGGLGAVEAEEGRGRRLRPSHRPRRTSGVVLGAGRVGEDPASVQLARTVESGGCVFISPLRVIPRGR